MYYGQRDFRTDGTFVTTEWIVLFFIPLIPLRSLRVRPHRSSGFSVFFASWSSKHYSVHQTTLPNWKQVLYTYAFLLGSALWVAGCVRFTDAFTSLRLLFVPLLVVPFGVLYLVRNVGRQMMSDPDRDADFESVRRRR